ncbi:calcium-binding protein [Archangium lipolyticum]|uniref:calcium-binding protein n=1 Tax=Archangium lipolyticum TaxID=2970465 RepID=UPI002149F937|nr:calcium-binding protein [Archangium lipolyticum]
MRPITPRRIVTTFVVSSALLGGSLPAAAQTGPAAAAAAPNGTTTSDAAQGLRYTGGAGANRITVVTIPGDRFLVSDTSPITAGPGCTPTTVGGGLFAVSCLAPRTPNGQVFKPFRVDAGGGDDVVNNSSAAPMRATGGPGNDTLNGGFLGDNLSDGNGRDTLRGHGGDDTLSTDFGPNDGLSDVLDGGDGADDLRAGPGNDRLIGGAGDDTLRGGAGADVFDGGPGAHDAVVYLDNAHDNYVRLVASIDNTDNDGIATFGPPVEKDNILDSVEDLFGGRGPDVLVGNDGPNRLQGNLGNDVLVGNKGADVLRGGPDNDTLATNDLFGVPQPDGAIDTADGGSGTDTCHVPANEGDVRISCENIDTD